MVYRRGKAPHSASTERPSGQILADGMGARTHDTRTFDALPQDNGGLPADANGRVSRRP